MARRKKKKEAGSAKVRSKKRDKDFSLAAGEQFAVDILIFDRDEFRKMMAEVFAEVWEKEKKGVVDSDNRPKILRFPKRKT